MLKRAKNQKGFTLIELIVVIAILGILALIAIPRLSGFTESAKLNSDYSTAATIGHAAAAYVAATNTHPASVDALRGTYMPSGTRLTAQTNGGATWTLGWDGDDPLVLAGSSGPQFYPRQ